MIIEHRQESPEQSTNFKICKDIFFLHYLKEVINNINIRLNSYFVDLWDFLIFDQKFVHFGCISSDTPTVGNYEMEENSVFHFIAVNKKQYALEFIPFLWNPYKENLILRFNKKLPLYFRKRIMRGDSDMKQDAEL